MGSKDYCLKRVPSYTDRVLMHCEDRSKLKCKKYGLDEGTLVSDHFPVVFACEVEVQEMQVSLGVI